MSEFDYTNFIDQKLPVNIEDEMRKSYLDYAMSVIIGRALPDVRDGLKPVHRRILFGMYEQGNTAGKAYKKSARIVGDVMGKYHPHGDTAIYDSVVRMAQEFSMRYELVDGQGNFGSLDGDNAAAMRYTEVRLTRLAEELMRDDIDKETIDWVPNYDGLEREPSVLPAKFPNLLVNGSSGIAVGMATNIPPHNIGEVVDACLMMIEKPKSTVPELMKVMPGPDFPTAGFIHGLDGIYQAYKTGRGIVQMRARAIVETSKKGDKQQIVVTEIPYMTNKARLLEKISELVRDKRIDGIDPLIALIRGSRTPADAKSAMIERWQFSEAQASAILAMRLQQLTGLERDKITAEYAEVQADIRRLREILGSEQLVLSIIS